MGQSASSEREQDRSNRSSLYPIRQRHRRTHQLPSNIRHRPEDSPLTSTRATSTSRQPHSRNPSAGLLATFTRQISSSSIGVVREVSPQAGRSGQRDAIFYEQQEERPLVDMQDLGLQNAPITHITASPMPRRSRLSRLNSIIMSRDANSGRAEDRRNQEASWQRPLTRDSLEIARQVQWEHPPHQNASPTEISEETVQRGRNQMTPISRPLPSRADSPMPSSYLSRPSHDYVSGRSTALNHPATARSGEPTTQQLSRLARIRRSITQQVEVPLFSNQSPNQTLLTPHSPQHLSRDSSIARGSIPQTTPNTAGGSEFDGNTSHLDADSNRQDSSDFLDVDTSFGRRSSWADRLADLSHGGRRENRRVSSMLSARSTRLLRRDQDGPLPRILNLAAFALAARLAGSNPRSTQEIRSVGADATDGNIQNLLRGLQNAIPFTPAELAATENDESAGRPTSPANPLNYLRVFRFVSVAAGATANTESPSSQGQTGDSSRQDDIQGASRDSTSQDSDGRTVTLVVIGVRSIPSEDTFRETSPNLEPLVDSLLEAPSIVTTPSLQGSQQGAFTRPTNRTQISAHSRPGSSGGSTPFLVDNQRQRQQRTSILEGTQSSDGVFNAEPATSSSLTTSDSPPGPRPPPSTPAENTLSAFSSQVTTPSRRLSSASVIQQGQIPTRDATIAHPREAIDHPLTHEDHTTLRVHHRRRSESESARHRELGAGASRRNGVVAPDEVDNPAPAVARSRSWLIYVVGTNISEDHPALTAPSLFTDNPSYEDMLLLSSLLGPVRPPVASPEEVTSSGGLYRVCVNGSLLTAESTQGDTSLQIGPDERCLVCLEEYQPHEELRQLNKCSHAFHRTCIDEWLTTGRNSCPLCRGQGVSNEKREGDAQSAMQP